MEARKLVSAEFTSHTREPGLIPVCSLTTKLPFDEDEFDFVHVRSITRGVPETKVDAVR